MSWQLEGLGRGGILFRGEVAERLNAAVSKTVMSVIPASGVRIPPSPLRGASVAPVASSPDDPSLAIHDHRADRDLSLGGGFRGEREGSFHPLHLIHLSKSTTAGRGPPRVT